tara:strand:- start:1490 stop:1666 length:177 start_codon:yes stop_codon:yes gene_type:complete
LEEAMPGLSKAVVVLLDSLNRHTLGCHGGTQFATAKLDRFSTRVVRFTGHYVAGSKVL